MKKLLYSFITVLSTVTASQAQLVLDRADFPSAGDRFAMATDTLVTVNSSFYSTGTGKTWTFSNMTKDERFVSKYHNAASTPDGAMFPTADLALQEDSTDGFMYYMKTSNSEIRMLGGNDSSEFSSVDFRAFIFPLQYNTEWKDTNSFDETMPGADFGLPFDSVRIKVTVIFNNKVDAEGTISVPDYTGSALRVSRLIWNSVELSGKTGSFPWFPITSQEDSTMSFDFVNDNGKNWIARFEQIEDNDYEVLFQDKTPMSVKKISNAQMRVYPNPAKNMIIVDLEAKSGKYSILSMTGAEVLSGSLSEGSNELPLSGIARGVYMMNVIDNNGAVRAERIVIE